MAGVARCLDSISQSFSESPPLQPTSSARLQSMSSALRGSANANNLTPDRNSRLKNISRSLLEVTESLDSGRQAASLQNSLSEDDSLEITNSSPDTVVTRRTRMESVSRCLDSIVDTQQSTETLLLQFYSKLERRSVPRDLV